ncbi:acetyl-CoA carboxylase biotin carboxyl carrier protein [Enterococcus sp. BWB1-3]|uniref:acetyl-CoA carboxylase biotin carboxyl carrier protein n=1 Tax=unclassified Enterococcus TaxID=2608891 RepID=UPI001921C501|nr:MULTISPECIES: acetyl-CoA carboxylase biotin carboxyl carrier protein [unclassified Enterococcus]MBL1230847.1 acetyl-CoA carboxylase biotin carboxyl carrier protein [Enterococcus sp. BWB1-3]MCB5956011.1 acetyl-CoA carboxylase biotin carboxyl carrier protein [Enterococcus sp. CWB-B31]
MDISEVKELLAKFDQSSLTEFDLREGSFELYMNKNTISQKRIQPQEEHSNAAIEMNSELLTVKNEETKAAAVENKAVLSKSENAAEEEITSPLVGIVYLQPAPDKEAFKKVGDAVKKGDVVCIIEAMKLMNEITSTVDGTIAEILVGNEEVVEFGQPLFKVTEV